VSDGGSARSDEFALQQRLDGRRIAALRFVTRIASLTRKLRINSENSVARCQTLAASTRARTSSLSIKRNRMTPIAASSARVDSTT
jgi:hypothetical protein